MSLTALGTCIYNNWTFSPNVQTLSYSCTPILDGSGRSLAYSIIQVTLRDKIGAAPGQTLDATIATARQQLQAVGGALSISSKGFGDLSVNAGGAKKDVLWGPVPRFAYRPLGRDLAGEITWSVEVHVPEQCISPSYQFKLMEAVYTVAYDIDRSGYSKRTIQGYIRIPQSKVTVNARTLTDNADAYREQIFPALATGFRRTPGTFALTPDKCRLDFSGIVDEEMPDNCPPPGIIEVSATQEVNAEGPFSAIATGTITAEYEVAKGIPRAIAYQYFLDLLTSRWQYSVAAGKGVIFRSIRLADSIYSRSQVTCSATYAILTQIKALVQASGLFQPVPNSDWTRWAGSLANGAWSARGNAKLAFNNADDYLIDLCQPNQAVLTAGGMQQNVLRATSLPTIRNLYPAPDQSFLHWENFTTTRVIDRISEMKTLPLNPIQPTLVSDSNTSLTATLTATSTLPGLPPSGNTLRNLTTTYQPDYPPGASDSVIQYRGLPKISVTLEGRAIRAGYPIDPPTLVAVGGVPVVPMNDETCGFWQSANANWFGVPLVTAFWKLTWCVPAIPAGGIGVAIPPIAG